MEKLVSHEACIKEIIKEEHKKALDVRIISV
jgi:hypothetical protein